MGVVCARCWWGEKSATAVGASTSGDVEPQIVSHAAFQGLVSLRVGENASRLWGALLLSKLWSCVWASLVQAACTKSQATHPLGVDTDCLVLRSPNQSRREEARPESAATEEALIAALEALNSGAPQRQHPPRAVASVVAVLCGVHNYTIWHGQPSRAALGERREGPLSRPLSSHFSLCATMGAPGSRAGAIKASESQEA
jgi:hypothetical protein